MEKKYLFRFHLEENNISVIIIFFSGVDDLLVEDGEHYLFWYKKL